MDVERTIQFILETQARHEVRLATLSEQMGTVITHMTALADNMSQLASAMTTLAESQTRTLEGIAQLERNAEQRRRESERQDHRIEQLREETAASGRETDRRIQDLVRAIAPIKDDQKPAE